jgi:dehydrogenase/reductase SDR family protein 7B
MRKRRAACSRERSGGSRGRRLGSARRWRKRFAKEGAKLILSGRNVEALNDVARNAGGETLVLPFEATDYARIPALVEQAWAWGGRVDGFVNNAGISQRSLAVDTVFEVYEKIIAVDLLAPIALAQALLPRMTAAGGGDLVSISSVAGIAGPPLRSAYSAAKAGLIGYHDSVRSRRRIWACACSWSRRDR